MLLGRAADQGKKPVKGTVSLEGDGSTALAKALMVAIRGKKGAVNLDYSSDEADEEIGSRLETKRTMLRKIARQKPDYLLTKALQNMREQVTSMTGEDASDPYEPICLRYFLSVFLPNCREVEESVLREIRTLAESIDGSCAAGLWK